MPTGKCGIAWAGSEMNEDFHSNIRRFAIVMLYYTQAGSGAADLH